MKKATMLKINLAAITVGDLEISDSDGNNIVVAIGQMTQIFLEDYLSKKFEIDTDMVLCHLEELDETPKGLVQ